VHAANLQYAHNDDRPMMPCTALCRRRVDILRQWSQELAYSVHETERNVIHNKKRTRKRTTLYEVSVESVSAEATRLKIPTTCLPVTCHLRREKACHLRATKRAY